MKTKIEKQSNATPENYTLPKGQVLMLRTADSKRQSHGGFQWPALGPISAPDWSPHAGCGQGLHGLLRGEGGQNLMALDDTKATWQVVEVEKKCIVAIDGGEKYKFPRGVVIYSGSCEGATQLMLSVYPGAALPKITATAGYAGTATAGDSGTATAGYAGTATAGYAGTATAGTRGTATAGDSGTATAGYAGTATAGDSGTATAGDSGTATAGDSGTATAGEFGALDIIWYDGARYRRALAYVGENGILPNKPYRLDERGSFVPAAS
jgi:hypothetical protein